MLLEVAPKLGILYRDNGPTGIECFVSYIMDLLQIVNYHIWYVSYIVMWLQVEIGRRSAGDNVLEREGYAVSAGFALGLVALGNYG